MRFRPYVSGLYGIIQAPVYRFIVDKQQQLRLYDSFIPHGLDSSFNVRALEFLQDIRLYIGDCIPMSSYHSYAAVRLPDESYVVIGPLDFSKASKQDNIAPVQALGNKANKDRTSHATESAQSIESGLSIAQSNYEIDKSKQTSSSPHNQASNQTTSDLSYEVIKANQVLRGDETNTKAESTKRETVESTRRQAITEPELLQLKLRTVNLWCDMICQIVVRQELPPENEQQIYNDADELIPQSLKTIAKEVPLRAPHNQYRYELATLDAIRNGDVEMVDRSFSIPLKGKFGILSQDPLRSMKNHVHNLSTLASRAAISSGILPERAFALSDKFFMASEECNTIEQCEELRKLCARSFALMVKEYRSTKQQESNPLVRDIMLIISRELFNRFTVQDLAQRLNHSYEHLERIFKAQTGLSLATYIKQEKLKQAQELIRDTQDSIADIAHILGFESASHFTKAFKNFCGLTPRQYRKVFSSEHVG